MALVFLCTLAQVEMGTLGAVNTYMRSWFAWWSPRGSTFQIPVFPGGALVGLVLIANLTAAMIKRFTFSWNKAGLWVIHMGLILLVAGEFVAGALQVDNRMIIREGETVNFLESYRDTELVIRDVSDPAFENVFTIPSSRLAKGGALPLPGSPLAIKVVRFYKNAELSALRPEDHAPLANRGVGASVKVTELPGETAENKMNLPGAIIEPVAGNQSYGVWLISTQLGAPQSFVHEGRTYVMSMRIQRQYLPYSLTLKKFRHDVYPGTEIPKNFSSLVQLQNTNQGDNREVLIYMNQPLRYQGRTFYQSGYEGDTITILQVVWSLRSACSSTLAFPCASRWGGGPHHENHQIHPLAGGSTGSGGDRDPGLTPVQGARLRSEYLW